MEKTRSRGVGEEELGLDGLEKVQFFATFPCFIHFEFSTILVHCHKSRILFPLLKPWTIKTEQVLLLWHEATITLHFNVGLWYIVLPLRSILLRKFIGGDERSEETTLYSGPDKITPNYLLFHRYYSGSKDKGKVVLQ